MIGDNEGKRRTQSDGEKNETVIREPSIWRMFYFELLAPLTCKNLQRQWILIRQLLMRACAQGGLDWPASSARAPVLRCGWSHTAPSNESSSFRGELEKWGVWGGRRQAETHGGITRLGFARGGVTGERESSSEGYISEATCVWSGSVYVYVCVRVDTEKEIGSTNCLWHWGWSEQQQDTPVSLPVADYHPHAQEPLFQLYTGSWLLLTNWCTYFSLLLN